MRHDKSPPKRQHFPGKYTTWSGTFRKGFSLEARTLKIESSERAMLRSKSIPTTHCIFLQEDNRENENITV